MKFNIARICSCSILLFLSSAAGHAGEVLNSYVGYEDGHYLVQLEMKIQAEQKTVYAILTDFNHLKLLNDSIKTSRLLSNRGKEHAVLIVAEGCVWIFCRQVKQVQRITELGRGYIKAVVLPAKSDLKYGRVLWHVQQEDNVTIIHYRADFVPDFFIPPLIGPYLMKGRLLEEGEKTIRGIEHRAQTDEEN